MSDVVDRLKYSTKVVKNWGQHLLPNGKLLSEQLTFNGISMWEVVAPMLALYFLPIALSSQGNASFFGQLRPHVSLAKRKAIILIKRVFNRVFFNVERPPCGGEFLFMGFSGYMYRDVLQPVAERLSEKNGCDCLILFDEMHSGQFHASINSLQYGLIWSYWDAQVANEATLLNAKLLSAIAELKKMKTFPRLIESEEVPWRNFQDSINWLFNFHLPLLVPQIAISRRVLTLHRPKVIISADVADPRARIYGLVGNYLGIPSFEIQFGPNGQEGVEWQFMLADHVATWGETTKQDLLEHGVKDRCITITGSPRHDSLVNIDVNKAASVRARLGIPSECLMVLCASTYQQKEYNSLSDPELLRKMKKATFKSAAEVEGIFLVIKPHPLENVKETEKLIGSAVNVVIVDPSEDIRELIKVCDVFLGFGSTATVDAIIADKLTICPVFPGWLWSEMFVKSNAVLVPQSEEDLVRIFCSIRDGLVEKMKATLEPFRALFLQKLAFKIDGRSTERVVMAIEELKQGVKK